jgi:hypothetical protein
LQPHPPEHQQLFKLFPAYSGSLKLRITLLTLAIALLVFLSLMLFSGQTFRPRLKELLAAQQLATVSLVADEINEALVFRLKSLDKLAMRLTPEALASGKAAQTLLDGSLSDADLFNAGLIVIDAQGPVLLLAQA